MSTARTLRFGPLDIVFDHRVLEPRPWTVMQADWAHEMEPALPPGRFVELGCGAGHIGLAAICNNDRELVQLDAAPAACDTAALNAAAAGLGDRVDVRCGNFEQVLHPSETFALVIADPPYLPTNETSRYPEDPRDAIDGGPDGLDGIRSALCVASAHVAPGGAVLLQVWGEGQARDAEPIARELRLGMDAVRVRDDRRAVVLLRPRA